MTPVTASAPTRIDLAGGTLDIPPLDLLVPGACTLNAAIDLAATARVEPLGSGFRIHSVDRGIDRRFDGLEELAADGELPLLSGLIAHFAPQGGILLRTDCASPAGAGLGGSSALAVAVAGALARACGVALAADEVLTVARDVETRVLRVPTGVQDYRAALAGGVQSLVFGVAGPRIEPLTVDLAALRRRIVLIYTGQPRSSGINNWEITRAFLDGDAEVRERLEGIARHAAHARRAMEEGDLDGLAEAVGGEWAERRRLRPGVSTATIDRLIERATAAGAVAAKVCGAGGGGCVLLLVAEGRRGAVEEAARSLDTQVLEFSFAASGLSVVADRADDRA